MDVRKLIHSEFARTMPPHSPFLRIGRVGLSFNKNIYEDLAPTNVWKCLFTLDFEVSSKISEVIAVSEDELETGGGGQVLLPNMDSLRDYWDSDYSFVRKHYLVSTSGNWLARIDGDVTTILGLSDFMSEVIHAMGGPDAARNLMRQDFDAVEKDYGGMWAYFDGLLVNAMRPTH